MAEHNAELHENKEPLSSSDSAKESPIPGSPSGDNAKQDQSTFISPVQHITAISDNLDNKTIDDGVQCSIENKPFTMNSSISPTINKEEAEYSPKQGTEVLPLTTQSMLLSSQSHVSTSTSSMSLPIKENDDLDDRFMSSETNDSKKCQTSSSTTPQPTLLKGTHNQQAAASPKSGILTTEERIIYDQLVDAVRERDIGKVHFIHTAVCRVDPSRWECYINHMTETEQNFLHDHIQQRATHHQTVLVDRSINFRFGEETNENHIYRDHTSRTPLFTSEKQTSPFPYCEKTSSTTGVVPILDYSFLQEESRSITTKSKVTNPGTYRLESNELHRPSNKNVDPKAELMHAEHLLRLERQKSLQLECEITKLQQEVERMRQGYQHRNSISNTITGVLKSDHVKQLSSSGVSHGRSSISSAVGGSDTRPSQDEDELWHENRRLKLELETMQRASEKRERILSETQSFVSDLRAEVLRLSNDFQVRRLHSPSAHQAREEDSDRSLLYQVLQDYKQLSRDYDALQIEVEEAWDQVTEAERATQEAEKRASKLDKELVLLMEKNEFLRRSTKKRIDKNGEIGHGGSGKKAIERSSQSPQRSASAFGNVKQKRATESFQTKDDPQGQGNFSKSMTDLRNSIKKPHPSHQNNKNQKVLQDEHHLNHVSKRYDELQWQKREIETALSHIPATYSMPRMGATKRHTTLQKQEYLEKKLDRIDKELGSLRLKLRQANMLPSK